MQLHVALGELLKHVLRLTRNIKLSLEIFDLALGRIELDGHIVEVGCETESARVHNQEKRLGCTLKVSTQVELFFERLNLALVLGLRLGRQIAQSEEQNVSGAQTGSVEEEKRRRRLTAVERL